MGVRAYTDFQVGPIRTAICDSIWFPNERGFCSFLQLSQQGNNWSCSYDKEKARQTLEEICGFALFVFGDSQMFPASIQQRVKALCLHGIQVYKYHRCEQVYTRSSFFVFPYLIKEINRQYAIPPITKQRRESLNQMEVIVSEIRELSNQAQVPLFICQREVLPNGDSVVRILNFDTPINKHVANISQKKMIQKEPLFK